MVRKGYERALRESKIDQIMQLKSLKQIFPNMLEVVGAGSSMERISVGLELDELPVFA